MLSHILKIINELTTFALANHRIPLLRNEKNKY